MTAVTGRELGDLETYRRRLTAYCYRMLGSAQDSEDAVQETLVRAWRGVARVEDQDELRPWLYKIATNVCLDMLKGRNRRAMPMDVAPVAAGRSWQASHELALGAPRPDACWLQPIPDRLISSADADPADVVASRESVRLAFVATLQYLVPRQRAVLILRDVLRFRAKEVAELLETSEDAVNSTLRRARASLAGVSSATLSADAATADPALLRSYIEAFERYDVGSLVALLRDDAILSMPPFELWLQGIPDIRRFLAAMESEAGCDRVIEVAANGCPALAVYRPAGRSGTLAPFGIHVLEVAGGRIAAIHAFLEPGLFPLFALPPALEPIGLPSRE